MSTVSPRRESRLALVFAAAGTATAAGVLVTTKQIKNGTICLVHLDPKTIKTLTANARQAEYAKRASYAQDAVITATVRDSANSSQWFTAASRPTPGNLLALGSRRSLSHLGTPQRRSARLQPDGRVCAASGAVWPGQGAQLRQVSFDTAGLYNAAHPARLTAPG